MGMRRKLIKGAAVGLALGLVMETRPEVEPRGFQLEPEPTMPFVLTATLSATTFQLFSEPFTLPTNTGRSQK